MPTITFMPGTIRISVPAGSELLDAAKQAGVAIDAPCGGHGVCGKCLVKILSGTVDFKHSGVLPADLLADGYVLACRSRLTDEDITVEVTPQEKEEGKFSKASEDMMLIDSDLLPAPEDFDPLVKTVHLTVSAPVMGDGLSDFDRVRLAVQAELGDREVVIALSALRNLPNTLRQKDGSISIAYSEENGALHVIHAEPADEAGPNYGIAVDIGTTTVAVKLVDLGRQRIIASKTDYNGQIACGLDVISRINYAQKPERLEELRSRVLDTVNVLVSKIAAERGIDQQTIYSASVAGNTTMIHLLLGIEPEYIRLDPYIPAVYTPPFYSAAEVGLAIHPHAPVHMAPAVGSYVGGDITSGILCTDLCTASEELSLFIDIGTNGEMILGNSDFLMGCACSAGPAFEGGSIEHGMRASRGAIERVEIDKDTGLPNYAVIGNVPAQGICGSGMISLIANLFGTGWIDAAGKLDRSRFCPAVQVVGKAARYIIAPSEQAADGDAIYVSEADIDNLIRAKGAIYSACRVMLQKVEMDFDALAHIYIAGGFGRYLDMDLAMTIGLLPCLPHEVFRFIGNTSLTGAYMTLVSRLDRELQLELAQKITYLDLSTEVEYMNEYTAALFLPHTDERLFRECQ